MAILIYFPFIISFWIGSLLIRLLEKKEERIPILLFIFFSLGLGLGISACVVFSSLIVFNHFNVDYICLLHAIILIGLHALIFFYHRNFSFYQLELKQLKELWPLLFLFVIFIPFWIHAHFYTYGGWDAWSVWNLKARFIFLGGLEWQKMFEPTLWRSSPHYPFLLPLVIDWSWVLQDKPVLEGPTFTAIVFTFLTVGVLFAALREFTESWIAFLLPAILMSLPFYVKLALNQYSDIVVSFYLLSSVVCLIMGKKKNSATFYALSGLFLGFLSFTKPEGLAASFLFALLFIPYVWWANKDFSFKKIVLPFYLCLTLALVPTLLFKFLYAPDNITFINGLTSAVKPSTIFRLKMVLSFYIVEIFGAPMDKGWMISPNWHILWATLVVGLLLSCYKTFQKDVIILPFFFFGYMVITTFYYYLNTYFPIAWWMQVTLHRILFTVLPTAMLWVCLLIWSDKKNAAS